MKRVLVAVAAVAVIAAGCSSLDHGTVTAKQFDPGYYTTDLICAAYGTGSQAGVCRLWLPYQEWVPECWRLYLKSGNDTGSQCVPESTYQHYQIGQTYPGAVS